MRKNFLKYLTIHAIALCSFGAFAQVNTISPYSNFGIGELANTSTSYFQGMGGIGIGMFSDKYINLSNPASYGNLEITNFEFGMSGTLVNLNQGDLSQEENFANFSHLVLATPLGEKWSGAFGLKPISHIGYQAVNSFETETALGDTLNYKLIHEGEGGLNEAFIGGAYQLNENFSIGVNFNFIFGQIKSISDEQYEDQTFASIRTDQTINVQDVSYTLGAQYNKGLSDTRFISAGVTYKGKAELSSEETKFVNSYTYTGLSSSFQDTLIDKSIQQGTLVLPSELGLGFGIRELNKWNLGADLKFVKWSEYSLFGREENSLKDLMSFSLGGSYTPNHKDIRKFVNRIQYRAGLRYSNGYISATAGDNAGSTDITEFGINFGFGLPVRKNGSTLNFDFELGQRGTEDKSLVKEDYFKFQVSLSLRDKWFVKRKID